MGKLWGAVEAGGTKFICAVFDDAGNALADCRIATTTPVDTLAAAQQFFAAQQAQHGSFHGIGIAAFGPLDLHTSSRTYGHILATPKPHWSHTDLVTPFATRFQCPVAIDTDVNAAALAETQLGAGSGCTNVVYITVGTGIGGGVVVNGQPLHGALHPEMGHIRVLRHPDDVTFAGCCPFHGDCLEGLASGPAIIARYGVSLDQLPANHTAHTMIGYYLGQLATTTLLMLSPERVIFGGGVMQQQALLPRIRQSAASLLNAYAGLAATTTALDSVIVAPGLGERSGITGALVLAQRAVESTT